MNDKDKMQVGNDLRRRVRLRPVGEREDEDFLYELYATTRADELALTDWDALQRENFLRMQLAAQKASYYARFPDSQHSIVMLDESMVGRMWVARTDEEFRLLDIALMPAYFNAGIGTLLVSNLITEAIAAGKPLRHMVSKTNPAALRFYERLGFTVIDEISTHFQMEKLIHENER
jgi:ribosomal protein S18 acetylase RimI-like enzyme